MKTNKIIAALGIATVLGGVVAPFGAFAEDPSYASNGIMNHIDEIKINVLPVCTFGALNTTTGQPYTEGSDGTATVDSDKTTHTNGIYNETTGVDNTGSSAAADQGAWGATGVLGEDKVRTDTLAASMVPGTSSANIGITTLTVLCNNTHGYQITALGEDLTHESTTDAVIPAADGTGWTANSAASYWNMKAVASANGMTVQNDYGTAKAAPVTGFTTGDDVIADKDSAGNLADGETLTITYGAGINKKQESGTYTGTIKYTLAQLND